MPAPIVYGSTQQCSSNGVTVSITALAGRVADLDHPTEALPGDADRPATYHAPPISILVAEMFEIKFTMDGITPWDGYMDEPENALAFSIRIGGRHVETPLFTKPIYDNAGVVTLRGVLSRIPSPDQWVFQPQEPYSVIAPGKICGPFYNISSGHGSIFKVPYVCPAVTIQMLSCRLT